VRKADHLAFERDDAVVDRDLDGVRAAAPRSSHVVSPAPRNAPCLNRRARGR